MPDSAASSASRFASASSSSCCFFLAASNIAFSASRDAPQVFSAKVFAYSTSSVTSTLSKMEPDFTCHSSNPTYRRSFCRYSMSSATYSGLGIMGADHAPLYAGFSIVFWRHAPLNSGLGTVGASHSPSSSSSQSSGFVASGSVMVSGMSSQPSGLTSVSSGMRARSSQSSGLEASGSRISRGGRKSQWSSRSPLSRTSLSTSTA
mmetsp:Transcript_13083/g.54946  ORF Transcript_13083/g.54946 Transcript_13083/m.54946 type:complete len:205 (-) Transcript_13083:520-1134(-)